MSHSHSPRNKFGDVVLSEFTGFAQLSLKLVYSDRGIYTSSFVPTGYLTSGLVVTELLITSPVVSWRGWETPPHQHRG